MLTLSLMILTLCFKPSKDRYKLENRHEKAFVVSVVSNPQRIATNLMFFFEIQEMPESFKPSKDRYKLFAPVQVTEVDLQVSNPQRIATNCPCPRREHIVRGVSNPQRIATNNG